MNETPSPIQWFAAGEVIPGHGRVVRMSYTAYELEDGSWVPFYGPNGVHTTPGYVEPLVVLS